MDANKEKVQELINKSKEVFLENSLSNGGIIAANSKRPDYPKDAQDYSFVWPRDAAFISKACLMLGMREIPEKFFDWCEHVALDENNLLWHRYDAEGHRAGFVIADWFGIKEKLNKKTFYGELDYYVHPGAKENGQWTDELQPDHNGLVLWALYEYFLLYPKDFERFKGLTEKLADGITSLWDTKNQNFKYIYFDMWEEKIGYPGVNLTYDVAVICAGLEYALFILGEKESWRQAADSMRASLYESSESTGIWQAAYGKAFGKELYTDLFSDKVLNKSRANVDLDASLLALIYPTDMIVGISERISFMNYFLNSFLVRGGFIRYPGDTFNGEDVSHEHPKDLENTWPLIEFWVVIALVKSGEADIAHGYFTRMVMNTKDYFSEQIDEKGREKGAKPLALTHAMFVIAAKELGYI